MKRGDLSIQMVVIAILALLVLGVIAFIFYDQIQKAAADYTKKREQYSQPNPVVGSFFLIGLIEFIGRKWIRKDSKSVWLNY